MAMLPAVVQWGAAAEVGHAGMRSWPATESTRTRLVSPIRRLIVAFPLAEQCGKASAELTPLRPALREAGPNAPPGP